MDYKLGRGRSTVGLKRLYLRVPEMPKSKVFFTVWFWHLFLGLDQTLNADLNILNLHFGQSPKFGIIFCTLVLAKLLKIYGNHILVWRLHFGQDPKSRTWFLRLRFWPKP